MLFGLFVTKLNFSTMFSVQGYQGMVDGGKHIVEANWNDVSGILQLVNALASKSIA